MIALRNIRTGKEWLSNEGVIPVSQITYSHAKNLIRWLQQRAWTFYDLECFSECSAIPPTADGALMGFEESLNDLFDQDPMEWLEAQPLFKKLQAIVNAEKGINEKVRFGSPWGQRRSSRKSS